MIGSSQRRCEPMQIESLITMSLADEMLEYKYARGTMLQGS